MISQIFRISVWALSVYTESDVGYSYLPTPQLGQDTTQGHFLSGV